MNVVTADWHLDHGNIITYCARTAFMNDSELAEFNAVPREKRGRTKIRYSQATINRMNDAIIDGVNAVAGPDDVVWNLGDAIFAGRNIERCFERLLAFRKRIHAKRMYLIFGNHDKLINPSLNYKRNAEGVILMNRHAWTPILKDRQEAFTEDQFHQIFDRGFIRHTTYFKGVRFTMDHYAGLVWEGNGRGTCMLYGHSHSNLEPWVEKYMPEAKMIDVGIDNRARMGLGYTPWMEDELLQYMADKKGTPVDHHGAE